jgi:hypothetical protein
MKFQLGDRVRQFVPHLGYRTGRVVVADEETGTVAAEDDTDGHRFLVKPEADNLTRNPPRRDCDCDA